MKEWERAWCHFEALLGSLLLYERVKEGLLSLSGLDWRWQYERAGKGLVSFPRPCLSHRRWQYEGVGECPVSFSGLACFFVTGSIKKWERERAWCHSQALLDPLLPAVFSCECCQDTKDGSKSLIVCGHYWTQNRRRANVPGNLPHMH